MSLPQPIVAPAHFKAILITIFFLNIIEYLQSGMIAFAARPIMGEIGSSPEEFGLINAVYASIAVIMIAKQHWMIERLGWRRYIQIALSFFMMGALVCYFSHSFYTFLAGRAIMALGGASFMTSARLLTLLLPVGVLRFVGIRFFVVSMIFGMAGAPFLASLVVTHDSWNMVFILLIVFSVLAWLISTIALPDEIVQPKHRMTQSSPMIFMLLLLGGFSFFYVFRRSSYNFYSNTFMLLLMVFGSLIFLILFFFRLHTRKLDKPLMQIRPVFQNKLFILSTLFSSAFYIVTASSNYVLPLMLQQGLNFSWASIGLYMSFGFSTAFIAWKIFSTYIQRSPMLKKYLLVGGACIAFYGWSLSNLTPQATLSWHILPALLANGFYMIFFMSPVTAAGFRSLRGDDMLFSHAMQLRNIIAQLALSIGVSWGIVFMQWRTTIHFSQVGESFNSFNPNFLSTLDQLTALFSHAMSDNEAQYAALTQLQNQLQQQAILMASIDFFHYVMIFGVVVTIVFLIQRTVK